MANKNTKFNRNLARQNGKKGVKSTTVEIATTLPGSTQLGTRRQVISAVNCPRKSDKEKGKVCRTSNNKGMTIMEQNRWFYGKWFKTI